MIDVTPQTMPLTQAPTGICLKVVEVVGSCEIKKKLAQMGIFPDMGVFVVQKKLGQIILSVQGARLALGKSLGASIRVEDHFCDCVEESKLYLNEMKVGQKAIITGYASGDLTLLQRLLEMGLVRGTELEVIRIAPMGDPIELSLRGYNLSVRLLEASMIEVEMQTSEMPQK